MQIFQRTATTFELYQKNFKHLGDKILERFQEVFNFHRGQRPRAKSGMQIWFSAINSLVLPSSSACCPWDNINELAFHYSWSPTPALRKGKILIINKLTLIPDHLNAFGWNGFLQ